MTTMLVDRLAELLDCVDCFFSAEKRLERILKAGPNYGWAPGESEGTRDSVWREYNACRARMIETCDAIRSEKEAPAHV